MKTHFQIYRTELFEKWLQQQNRLTQVTVQIRLDRIALEGHFGVVHFFDGIVELKWKSGLRVYTARMERTIVIILAGGTKHGQSKDIKKAKKLLDKIKSRGFTST